MDPFSVIIGTVGLLDVCSRLIIYLKDVKGSIARTDREIEAVTKDVAAIKLVTELIDSAVEAKKERVENSPDASQGNAGKLWQNATNVLESVMGGCQEALTKMSVLIQEMKNRALKGSGILDDFLHVLRKQARQEDYYQLRTDLNNSLTTLQLMLNTIQL